MNEETSDRRHNPGRAAIFSTIVLLALYMLVSIAAQAYGGIGTKGLGLANLVTAPDVLANLGQSVLGGTLNKLLILATLVMTYAFAENAIQMWKPSYGSTSFHGIGGVFLLGIGTLVLGLVIMLVYRLAQPQFFLAGRSLPEAPELVELAGI